MKKDCRENEVGNFKNKNKLDNIYSSIYKMSMAGILIGLQLSCSSVSTSGTPLVQETKSGQKEGIGGQIGSSSGEAMKGNSTKDLSWAGSMRGLQQSLNLLNPFIFNEASYLDAKNEKQIELELKNLSERSKNVNHNPTMTHRDPSIRFVGSQFSEDLDRAYLSFQNGKKGYSRYQMMKVSSYCVECHTASHGGSDENLGKKAEYFKSLSIKEKAELLVANRDFEEAYNLILENLKSKKTYDNFTLDKQIRLAFLISVRHEVSFEKSKKIVDTLNNSRNLPLFIKAMIPSLEKSMAVWNLDQKKSEVSLAKAKKIFSNGSSEIDTLRSLSMVHQLFAKGLKGEDEAQALYLAGQAYEQLNEVSPLELQDSYYKACIHQMPGSSIARKCYQALEDSMTLAYTGSSGTHLPVEIEVQLKELRDKAGIGQKN